ncbi:MAG: GntR family transcriptional regulator [Spirochaetales bacterium]|nr:GntR family transcriptional regulator [Spirochaetales bacterium]
MAKTGASRVVRITISEQIKEQLIEDIFHHKYKPGEKMVESNLAKEFNVSQTSIREALRSLIAMGFLESEPFKGITVRSLSKEDLVEVYTVRGTLETLAATLAAERISDEEIKRLEDICDAMIKASEEGDVPLRIKLNINFHEALMQVSGNKLLVKLYEYLQFATWSMMTGTLSTMDSITMATRHQKIVAAIKSRDQKKIEIAMKDHIASGSKPVLDSMETTS